MGERDALGLCSPAFPSWAVPLATLAHVCCLSSLCLSISTEQNNNSSLLGKALRSNGGKCCSYRLYAMTLGQIADEPHQGYRGVRAGQLTSSCACVWRTDLCKCSASTFRGRLEAFWHLATSWYICAKPVRMAQRQDLKHQRPRTTLCNPCSDCKEPTFVRCHRHRVWASKSCLTWATFIEISLHCIPLSSRSPKAPYLKVIPVWNHRGNLGLKLCQNKQASSHSGAQGSSVHRSGWLCRS